MNTHSKLTFADSKRFSVLVHDVFPDVAETRNEVDTFWTSISKLEVCGKFVQPIFFEEKIFLSGLK